MIECCFIFIHKAHQIVRRYMKQNSDKSTCMQLFPDYIGAH